MKKIFKLLILSFIIFSCVDVRAAASVLEYRCTGDEINNLNSLDFVNGPSSGMIRGTKYDIAEIGIDNSSNTLYLTGWMFNIGEKSQTLGSNTTIFAQLKGSNGTIPMEVIHASGENHGNFSSWKNPKWYDLTYWVCARNNQKCVNPKYTYAGGFSAHIDINTINQNDTYSIQIKTSDASSWTTVQVANPFIKNPSSSSLNTKVASITSGSTKLSVKVKGSVLGHSGFNCDSMISWGLKEGKDNGFGTDNINAWFHPNEATLNTQKLGNISLAEFRTDQWIACKGECSTIDYQNYTNTWGPGMIKFYPIRINSSQISYSSDITSKWNKGTAEHPEWNQVRPFTNGSAFGGITFVPKLWFEFEGAGIKVKIENGNPPSEPSGGDNPVGGNNNPGGNPGGNVSLPSVTDPPMAQEKLFTKNENACKNKTVYSLYYFFNQGIRSFDEAINHDAFLSYGIDFDAEDNVLTELGNIYGNRNLNWNDTEDAGQGVIKVTNDESKRYDQQYMLLREFYDHAVADADSTTRIGTNYYLRGGGYVKRVTSTRGQANVNGYEPCEGNLSDILEGNVCTIGSLTRKNVAARTEYEAYVVRDYSNWVHAVVEPTGASNVGQISIEPLKGKRHRIFQITRNYNKSANLIIDKNQKISNQTEWNNVKEYFSGLSDIQLFQPAVYRWDFCVKQQETTCDPTLTSAECVGTNGTKAQYHESDELQTCTLDENAKSGFTLVSSDETNNYCTVACKDDIDILAPTKKWTAAGMYFTLNDYQPEIKGTRTCVTSRIDTAQYNTDLENKSNEMREAYIQFKDFEGRYNSLDNISETPMSGESEYWILTTPQCDDACEGYVGPISECVTDNCKERRPWEYWQWSVDAYIPKSNSLRNNPLFGAKNNRYGVGGWTSKYEYGENANDYYSYPIATSEYNDQRLADFKNEVYRAMEAAKERYEKVRDEYQTIINSYAKCFSWTDSAPMTTSTRSDNFDVTFRSGNTNQFGFEPKVTFNYDDKDNIFGRYAPLEIDRGTLDTTTYYWDGDAPGKAEDYSGNKLKKNSAGGNGYSPSRRTYWRCTGGDECERFDGDTYSNTTYIQRVETITHKYHLPPVYTIIPSGKVTLSNSGGAHKSLDYNAVPVNINTPAGNYNYTIKVSNVQDSVRTNALNSIKKGTNIEEDFGNSSVFSAGNGSKTSDGYKCDYDVINDIYGPDPNDNNKWKVQFFYRPVDTLDISHPNANPLGYNWNRDKNERAGQVIDQIRKDAEDYQELIREDHGKFTFKLTPTVMKQIRYYNATQSTSGKVAFADFRLTCKDTNGGESYHCYSPFLSCLASRGKNAEGNDGLSDFNCNGVFGGTLENYKEWNISAARNSLISNQIKGGSS